MTNVMTEEHLRFLNENLDLVGEYLRLRYKHVNIEDLIVAVTMYNMSVDTFGDLGNNSSGWYVQIGNSIKRIPWQPILAYVEENANHTPIFK